MRIPRWLAVGFTAAIAMGASAQGQSTSQSTSSQPTPAGHVMVNPDTLQWTPSASGAMVSVLSGDPSKEGPFVLRLKLPDGWTIGPHWHPTDEHLTVLKGTFLMGMGEKLDRAALKPAATGSYMTTPAKTPHYAAAKGETILQLHGTGPFTTTYVNPADDPRKKGKTN